MTHYILVHGAWHGSWCWHKVATQLQELGHQVTTPDLPGHFHNKQDFQDVSLASYVEHIENLVRQSPQPVVLVGHSMAGIVVTQVGENMPDKIERIIYVSAIIPENNCTLVDEQEQISVPSVALELTIDGAASAALLNRSPRLREIFYNNCSDKDVDYALTHLQAQPLRPFIEPISISHDRFGLVPKLYITCLQDRAIPPLDQHRMYARIQCEIATLDTDHSPFFSMDRELVDLMCP